MLTRLLSPRTEAAYTLARVAMGLMFCFVGIQKIFGVLSQNAPPEVGTQLWFGGLIELVCGLLVALGAGTVYAAFLASGTMAVAYAQFHWKFRFDSNFFPAVNGGGPALLFSVWFLYVACRGAGPHSVDARRRRSR